MISRVVASSLRKNLSLHNSRILVARQVRPFSSQEKPDAKGESVSTQTSNSASAQPGVPYRKKKKNVFLTAGVPLLLLMISGSLLISFFLESQVEIQGKTKRSTSTRQFNLEEEHKKLLKNLDIENYSLSRIPRPEDGEEPGKK